MRSVLACFQWGNWGSMRWSVVTKATCWTAGGQNSNPDVCGCRVTTWACAPCPVVAVNSLCSGVFPAEARALQGLVNPASLLPLMSITHSTSAARWQECFSGPWLYDLQASYACCSATSGQPWGLRDLADDQLWKVNCFRYVWTW